MIGIMESVGMKKYIAALLCAVMMLSGCTLYERELPDDSSQAQPAAVEEERYEKLLPEIPLMVKNAPWRKGGRLRYSDFQIGGGDPLNEHIIENGEIYAYTCWRGLDDDGELLSIGSLAPRLWLTSTKESVLENYGETEVFETDLDNDRLYAYAVENAAMKMMDMMERSTEYVQYFYTVPGCSKAFAHVADLKFYFDSEGYIMLMAVEINEELMPLEGYGDDYSPKLYSQVRDVQAFDPEGYEMRVGVLQHDLFRYDVPRTDRPCPVYSFEDGEITARWYDFEGNEVSDHPVSAFDGGVKYGFDGERISLELNEDSGFNSDNTYFIFDKYFGCYRLYEPCWAQEDSSALLLRLR